jgi:hypothetical protein
MEAVGRPAMEHVYGDVLRFAFDPAVLERLRWGQTDVTQIDGHRFVRFRVVMVANLNTNQTARISSIQVPYQF